MKLIFINEGIFESYKSLGERGKSSYIWYIYIVISSLHVYEHIIMFELDCLKVEPKLVVELNFFFFLRNKHTHIHTHIHKGEGTRF